MSFLREANAPVGSRSKDRQRQLEPSRQPSRPSTHTADTKNVCRSRKSPKTKRYQQQQELKMQQHRDREERRVQELTDGIKNVFLPAAFNVVLPQCEDPRMELSPDRCIVVAAAALAVACLMNAPPWFLDFLIRVPWRKLKDFEDRGDSIEWMYDQLEVPEDERHKLVNTKIDPQLMATLLDFMYQDDYQDSVPPLLRPSSSGPQSPQEGQQLFCQQVRSGGPSMETVAALLDGATPLHCSAIRGNPAQVSHLLNSGADPTLKTIAGDLAIELVPVCGDKSPQSGHRNCRCMRVKEQEIWECRSGVARTLILKKCVLNVRMGLVAWFQLVMLCILNWFRMWGCSTCLTSRPVIQKHVVNRQEQKRKDARRRAQNLLDRMRQEALQGQAYLERARQQAWRSRHAGGLDSGGGPVSSNANSNGGTVKYESVGEESFRCFVRAVHALQNLDLQGDTIPQGFMDANAPPLETSDCQVLEDEQANMFCFWAESVLLKFRDCRCAGCAALAVQAIRMAHIQVARLFARVEKKQDQHPERWRSVGQALMRVVHVHICLLLDTEAKQSAMRASVWRAEHCLKEWERLRERGLEVDLGLIDECQVHILGQWAKTADSDLILAEALHGSSLLPSQTMTEVIDTTVSYSPLGLPYLTRSITENTIRMLELALDSATCPSRELSDLTRQVTSNAKMEIKAAENLREVVATKGTPGFAAAVAKLSEAIEAAEQFPHLAPDVSSAKELRRKWQRRAEAMERLERVMSQVRQPLWNTSKGKKQGKGARELQDLDTSVLEANIRLLEGAIDEAKESNIGVDKARKLLKELQAQAGAAEAAINLDTVMAKKPCRSGFLRSALAKAESACSSASVTSTGSGIGSVSEFLLPRIQAARKRLEIEKAVESLSKAATSCKAVTDLPKLEATILSARKVGAEELDPEVYQAASELRSKLHNGAKIRQALESAVKTLQKHHRHEDADAVERALEDAKECWDLVEEEATKAQEYLCQWRSQTESEAKLNKVIREGSSAEELSKAIQEASSAGIKVQAAKRVLKLMQSLEHAMEETAEDPAQYDQLAIQVDAAEQGGVNPELIRNARRQLKKILIGKAEVALAAALKEHGELEIDERCQLFKSALEQAGDVVDLKLESDDEGEAGEKVGSEELEVELSNESSTSEASVDLAEVQSVRELAKKVHELLRADECELSHIQAEKEERERAEKELLDKERQEKEKLEMERREKERQEKEEREKQEAERKEKEKAERERKQREKQRKEKELAMQLVQDKQRRDRPRQDRFRRHPAHPAKPHQPAPPTPQHQFPQEQARIYNSQLDSGSSEYKWDSSMLKQEPLNTMESDRSRLMEMKLDESGFIGGPGEMSSAGGSRDVGGIDIPQTLFSMPSNSGSAIGEGSAAPRNLGSDFHIDSARHQVDWAVDNSSNVPLNIPSDFSISAPRELPQDIEPPAEWTLEGLRDIQVSHNAPIYGMHVDVLKAFMPQPSSSSPWAAPNSSHRFDAPTQSTPIDATPNLSKSLENLGIVSVENMAGRVQPAVNDYGSMDMTQGGVHMLGGGDLGALDLSSPIGPTSSVGFKSPSVWGPGAEMAAGMRSMSLNPPADSSFTSFFQPEASGFDVGGETQTAVTSLPQGSGLGAFTYGAPGSAAFSHNNPTQLLPSFLPTSTSLTPSSPTRGLLGTLNPTSSSISDFSLGGGQIPQQRQSPFPGVGVGIPGASSQSFSGGHLRSTSLNLGDQAFAFQEDMEESLASLVRRDSSRAHL